jgi:hypothetical protein
VVLKEWEVAHREQKGMTGDLMDTDDFDKDGFEELAVDLEDEKFLQFIEDSLYEELKQEGLSAIP